MWDDKSLVGCPRGPSIKPHQLSSIWLSKPEVYGNVGLEVWQYMSVKVGFHEIKMMPVSVHCIDLFLAISLIWNAEPNLFLGNISCGII